MREAAILVKEEECVERPPSGPTLWFPNGKHVRTPRWWWLEAWEAALEAVGPSRLCLSWRYVYRVADVAMV